MYADFLISMRRTQEWNTEVQRALELDPFNPLFPCFYGWHLVYVHRYDEEPSRSSTRFWQRNQTFRRRTWAFGVPSTKLEGTRKLWRKPGSSLRCSGP